MNVGVIGIGYVGLVTGACFAEMGNQVTCVDIDPDKIEKLKQGICPIYEPGLEDILKRNTRENRLCFTTSLEEMLPLANVIFIAVGTPTADDGTADLSYVRAAAEQIGDKLESYKVIINKSTVPVGTGGFVADTIKQKLEKRSLNIEFDVISNPEFLKEGSAVNDFMRPDRIVVGSDSGRATEIMLELYSPFTRSENPILVMDRTSAELTKYAANGFLATKISFMNEIANLAEKVGADINHVRRGMGSDTRIGKHFLYPGPGYGGSCFPKDIKALRNTGKEYESPLRILSAVEEVNISQKAILGMKIKRALGTLHGKNIAIWGLAFKANTDDMRESPAIDLIEYLLGEQALIRVFDPEASANAKKIFGDKISYFNDSYSVLDDVDALAIVTEWPEFRHPDFDRMKKAMKFRIIADGRNLYTLKSMKTQGFRYYSIGRSDVE